MKISNNKYICEWCGENINWNKDNNKSTGDVNPMTKRPGKRTIVATLKCPKCNRNVSQKTSGGLK